MRALKKISLMMAVLLAAGISAFAQNRTISGKVVDATSQPVIAAAVMVDGTTNAAVTDFDGNFTLTVPAGTVVLDVNCLGYAAKKVTVAPTTSVVNITLEEDQMMLEETVVVGYGSQKKVNLTGAITTVSSKELENRASHSVTAMLQGSVPGLNISTSAGNPGSTPSINIRGVTSINSSDPIVLIDGAIGDMDRVNPNDIESISVIKDAAAAAIYGARAAYGVILITTKSGKSKDGKAVVRFSGRWGWEQPTTSTQYESTGYWSVYTINEFWSRGGGHNGAKYISYNDDDMLELLKRVNDKTENPERPWVVEQTIGGKKQWKYYANTDYWHELFVDQHPVQQYNVSVSGGDDKFKYYVSGGYDNQTGIMKTTPDVFTKYNLRSKLNVKINKFITLSNNTSFYSSNYFFQGVGNVENVIAYGNRHFLACYTTKNPDGSWAYAVPYQSYRIGNGRHIVCGNENNRNDRRRTDFTNTAELVIKPVKQFWFTMNYTHRFRLNHNTSRTTNFDYRTAPGDPMSYYTTGAGLDELTESFTTYKYNAANAFATYEDTFNKTHHVTAVAGFNLETQYNKSVSAVGENLLSQTLDDLDLISPNKDGEIMQSVSGGQSEYALMGFFGRVNYDYKGRYLFEASARYDGTSRFAKGHRWGFFPSASAGWRISEEPFFVGAKDVVNNLKVRASYGSLGNQNVGNYAYIRTVSISDMSYSFGESSSAKPKSSGLSAPNSASLTWETSQQYNIGIDAAFLNNRLQTTVEGYIRDTKDMLTAGIALPAVYGANSPKMNVADLRTSGYEISVAWKDQIKLFGKPFGYNARVTLSDFQSIITKFDNPTKSFAKTYYVGQRLGDIWGFVCDGIFQTDEEAQAHTSKVDQSYMNTYLEGGKWSAGNLKYRDLDGDGKISIGQNTADNPGDRVILGNSLAHLQYGLTLGFDFMGFDFSTFFQGTGNHYWYPDGSNFAFWGPYSLGYVSFLPVNFMDNVWTEDNPNAYFPKAGSNRASNSKGELGVNNTRYVQNIRYLRLKNLTVGYTIPDSIAKKAGIGSARVYFTGENIAYWSPIKKNCAYIDPEAAIDRDDAYNNGFYPWQKTFMFGIDITF